MLRGHRPRLLAGATTVLLSMFIPAGVAQAAPSTASPGAAAAAPCDPLTPFHAGNFSVPTTIDNPYLPMTPGTRLVYEGVADRGGGVLPHRIVSTVTVWPRRSTESRAW